VFTKIPSAAREPERFLLRLVRAALAAVYATMLADWRLVEWAEMFTMRAHDAERRSGSAARTHRAVFEQPDTDVDWPRGIDEDVERLPSLAQRFESTLHRLPRREVGGQAHGIRGAEAPQ